MSGSDSSSVSSGLRNTPTSCEALAFETILSSPQQNILPSLKVSDILEIDLIQQRGFESVVALLNGQPVGGLLRNSERIKECLSNGFQYSAEVRNIQGAKVTVFVKSI